MLTMTEADYVRELQGRGFGVVADGSAVIVIGKSSEIPIERPVGAIGSAEPNASAALRVRESGSGPAAQNALFGPG
jgi:hypothetical protein